MTTLYALSFSPWSEKARWALDHHRIDYKYAEHLPVIGELKLRVLLRKPKGRISVPVLRDGGRWFTDSFEIAQHADRIGSGPRLFPGDKLAAVEAWNERSEETLSRSRALMMLRLADNPEAAAAMIPPAVPAQLRPLLLPVAKKFVNDFIAKYNMREGTGSNKEKVIAGFDALREALRGGKSYLVGDAFSYADIAMAVTLQFVSAVDERYMATGPGGREGWTHREFLERYGDLVAWRDEIYSKHRRRG